MRILFWEIMQALPKIISIWNTVLQWVNSKEKKYLLAAFIDAALIIIILSSSVSGGKVAFHLISPLSNLGIVGKRNTLENFVFIPSSSDRIAKIDLSNLKYLSYFDIPILEDGSLNTDSFGYQNLTDSDTIDLFQSAHTSGAKILLTLTQMYPDTTKTFLDDSAAQQRSISEAIDIIKKQNLDGVTVDFEGDSSLGDYRDKFSFFISSFSDQIHRSLPNSEFVVALGDSSKDNFYDIKSLSASSDRIFMIASNFAVPENSSGQITTPIYGVSSDNYWSKISDFIRNLSNGVPYEKLVLERAWYGNGDNYPLYTPSAKADPSLNLADSHFNIDNGLIEQLVANVPQESQAAARKNIPYIVDALKGEGILNSGVLAYALATIEHETDGTFQPIEEIQGRISARRLGYEGGEDYFGRGFIQLTHLRNYKIMGERIGLGDKLVDNPELASTPEVAAKILAAFFKDNNIASLATQGDFIDARSPINPDRNGYKVALLAYKYEL